MRIQDWAWSPLDELLVTNSTLEYFVVAYDSAGTAAPGVPVQWTLAGDGSLTPSLDTTAFDPWEFSVPVSSATRLVGPTEGWTTVTATAVDVPGAPRIEFASTVVTARVDIGRCNGFTVDSVVVPSGRTVGWAFGRWDGRCPVPKAHNVTFEDDPMAGSQTMSSGTFTRTFTAGPLSIRFRCTEHSTDFEGPVGEVGRVIVR